MPQSILAAVSLAVLGGTRAAGQKPALQHAGTLCEAGEQCEDLGAVHLLQLHQARVSRQNPEHYWSGKNGDLLRTGRSEYVVTPDVSIGPAWSFREKGGTGTGLVRATPVIDADRNIYLSTARGSIYKFTPDGTQLWNFTNPVVPGAAENDEQIPCVLTLWGGSLFAGTVGGDAIALDMQTGRELWRVKISSHMATDGWSVTVGGGVLVYPVSVPPNPSVTGGSNKLVALSPTDGSFLWEYRLSYFAFNLMSAVSDGALLFADAFGTVHKVNLTDGRPIWKVDASVGFAPWDTTGGLISGPNGIVYVTSNCEDDSHPGRLVAYNASTGQQLWQVKTPYAANSAAAVGRLAEHGLAVVVGVGENPGPPLPGLGIDEPRRGRVMALDALTGDELWSYEMPAWNRYEAKGDTLSHMCLPDSFSNPAIGGDGTVYVGFEDGGLYAMKDSNADGHISASEVSRFETGAAFQGSPAIAPGLLVATPCDGMHVFSS